MADPRAVIALVIILFLVFAPDPPSQNYQQLARLEDVIQHEKAAIEILNSTFFSGFEPAQDKWLNLSGLTNETGFAWSYLDEFRTKSQQIANRSLGDKFSEKSIGQPVGYTLPFYHNVSGVVHGEWIRNDGSMSLQRPRVNISLYSPEGPFGEIPITGFARNLTGTSGKLRVRFSDDENAFATERRQDWNGRETDVARFVTASIELESTEGGTESWALQVHGVHFLETGQMLLSTTSDKFDGVYALPHFTWTPYFFRVAQRLIIRAVNKTISRQKDGSVRTFAPFTSNADGSAESSLTMPHCELIAFVQQQLVPMEESLRKSELSSILGKVEDELRFPTGADYFTPQPMRFAITAFSPDCGFAFESKGPPATFPSDANHLTGMKLEVEQLHARHHVLFYILVLAAQLWLLTRQMKEASTPSVRSRISSYTISMLALGDGFTTLSFAMISLFMPGLWVLLMATCFLAFLSVSFFGMRFLMEIWTVQAPERERRERERRAAVVLATANNPSVPASQPNTNSRTGPQTAAPTTPRRMIDAGSMPVIIPSDQDEPLDLEDDGPVLPITAPRAPTVQTTTERRFSFGALYTRFYFFLLATLFLSLNATSWPSTLSRAYFTSLAFLYLSFWVPQIYRNAYRNCRRALRWDFVVGQSLLRLSPFAYFWSYSWNVLSAESHFVDLMVLATWLWIQCLVLASQEILGPRWFVKSDWMPPAYDYHPILRVDEEGGNLPVGASEAEVGLGKAGGSHATTRSDGPRDDATKNDGVRVFDCAVCMQDIEVHVYGPDSGAEGGIAGAAGLLARRAYMMTPCRHIFHAKCLEGWMKYRLQCPICREDLPPM
ncbi:RING finger ubiquitin ligase [Myriangium duriaei CBS 260.36]|uniref:DSC E3 ubiquitin ligase complex subunit A n=1 Tax=Myriangium duriaei CBS 260.36 TaxID=1168546 RepID=A0A9P4J812_9PEZI|nr:RING finger ubiquitin ligase [Myriangium duriaei CBS 260.36]